MKKDKSPKIVELTPEQSDGLLHRLKDSNLEEEDKQIFEGLVHGNVWLRQQYESGKIAFHKVLRLLFGEKTEKSKKKPSDKKGSESYEEGSTDESKDTNKDSDD